MTPAFFSRRLALLAALASSVLLAACGGGGGDGGGNTNLRAINLTTDLPSVDLFTGDTRRFTALATDAVAASVSLGANTYTLNVKKANDPQTLLTGSYSLAKDQNYTAESFITPAQVGKAAELAGKGFYSTTKPDGAWRNYTEPAA